MDIEAFRKQLINANPKTASLSREEMLSEDLIITYEALDRITDNLGDLINETNDTDKLVYYAQLRGELCSHFNAIAMLLEEYNLGDYSFCIDDYPWPTELSIRFPK